MFFTRASLNGKICPKNSQVFSSKLGFRCRNSAVGSDATGGLSLNHKNSKKNFVNTHSDKTNKIHTFLHGQRSLLENYFSNSEHHGAVYLK